MEIEKAICLGTRILQHALQSTCMKSQWVYAVFWRILPRNFPPPKWDTAKEISNGSWENSRNWMLAWEDGFCDFNCGLQPGLFFKMTHEVYNFGEGIMGKTAANQGHKWIYRDLSVQPDFNFLRNSAYSHPRTWEAQFHSGIQTIALVAVREGLLQLGSTEKVTEDLNYVVFLRKKFNYLHTIPGILSPHPSSRAFLSQTTFDKSLSKESMGNTQCDGEKFSEYLQNVNFGPGPNQGYDFQACSGSLNLASHQEHDQHYLGRSSATITVVPSMSSLQALLSKLPSVTPSSSTIPSHMQ